MTPIAASPLVRLVRLPSVVTVPGDVLAGAAWGTDPTTAGGAARVASSSMAYLAGMAVNDWADRDEDAVERPTRPIPAGEISAETALMVGVGLSLGALALAGVRDHGRSSLGITVPLLLSVWAYDLKAKQTPAGPWTMALARTLDVLVGAGGPQRSALAPGGRDRRPHPADHARQPRGGRGRVAPAGDESAGGRRADEHGGGGAGGAGRRARRRRSDARCSSGPSPSTLRR